MSVFGGDSWGREAQYRKRRVDDLLLDAASSSSYKKLPSGKFACLVCPHNPILDTPLMLSMHMKASRHCAAEARIKKRELERENEMNKRIALSQDSISAVSLDSISAANTGISAPKCRIASKPLIERTRKAAHEVLHNITPQRTAAYEIKDLKSSWGHTTNEPYGSNSGGSFIDVEPAGKDTVQQPLDYRKRWERELKFTAAGWKRDCHGGWYRDENVEFDSDEEDPNICFHEKAKDIT